MRLRALVLASTAALLAGCATRPDAAPPATPALPLLRLAPAALGCVLNAQQRIEVALPDGARRNVDMLLEADTQAVNLALLGAGQVLARLGWDGVDLEQSRAAWAPAELSGERTLSELQMAGWPLAAVQQALPAGWQMLAVAQGRELRHGDQLRLRVRYGAERVWTLDNPQQHYRLTIHTLAHDAQPLAGLPAGAGPACF